MMNVKRAEQLGREAFEAGFANLPLVNDELRAELAGAPVGAKTDLLRAFSKGWTAANLATPVMVTCLDCDASVDMLEVFPKGRCVDCHAKAPEVQRELATMTADDLAHMWGGWRRSARRTRQRQA